MPEMDRGVDPHGRITVIEVEPTKSLFVEMLTRDLRIDRAILDLVDNCIDGAKRLRPDPQSSLDGLEIDIIFGDDEFQIRDNCGGFDIDTARRYAFKIGRPKDVPLTPHSIGQFGIGMKRALFKFGRWFEVVSTTTTERFRVVVDVDEWEADTRSWHFTFDAVETGLSKALQETGTVITVRRLRPEVAQEFALELKRLSLRTAVESAQQAFIERDLCIRFDGHRLKASPWQLRSGAGISPARKEEQLGENGSAITLEIFAGVSDSNPAEAGWYVLCNGRMVLEADQTPTTGWTYAAESRDVVVPKFHNQFARFRGYAFLDCADASRLPWNTTKTGVDQDSPIYRYAYQRMVATMRPVITFLNELDAENDNPPDERPFTEAVDATQLVLLRDIAIGDFKKPYKPTRVSRPTVKIQYQKDRDRVEELKEALSASSAKEAGEQSFELAYQKYVVDEEADGDV